MPTSAAFPATAATPITAAPLPARVSWILFDWAVQPFHTLVVTFLFAPYFANVVVGNPDDGQVIWASAAALAGVFIAIGSPVLGAMADGRGRRKPWILLFSAVLVLAMSALWFAAPGASTGTMFAVLFAFVCAYAAAEFISVFTNAFMPSLVPREQLGRLSGTGWAMGYAGGLAALLVVMGLIVPWPGSPLTLFGLAPLIPADIVPSAGDRSIGPFAALWYFVFIIPFFLFVPDERPRPASGKSIFAELTETLRSLPAHRDMLYFLVARLLYSDGLAGIFMFGGIYGRAVFGWQVADLALFGIIVIATGILGALIGGFIDDRIGPKRVIVGALFILIAGAAGILSVDSSHVFFTLEVDPKTPGSGPLSSTGELVFLAFAVVIGLVSAPVGAASRSLLARLAPPDKITQYFGLFAFSGKATAFLAPALVAGMTLATGDQRLGMATILLFLVAGIALMIPVRVPR